MAAEKRPWGGYEILFKGNGFQVKRVEVAPGLRLSLQKHLKRAEKWIFVEGAGDVILGEKKIPVAPGSFAEVPAGEIHRVHNTGKKPLVFIEVQLGNYLGEDDIVRLEDDFARV
ncbi:MAG: phosphomannose isomerase type II C-terminal cupin domain [Candidatus Omnitrophica bacterium]|nr:phosphomannose isomerase type II C-terminal cupin domain [Candidatus Omnitrophota bacterium]